MNGWLNADLFYNGLKAAGPNFSRQALMDAINKMTKYQANGLLNGVNWTVAYTKSDGTYCQFFSTIQNSKYVMNYSKPGKPFLCVLYQGGKLSSEYSGSRRSGARLRATCRTCCSTPCVASRWGACSRCWPWGSRSTTRRPGCSTWPSWPRPTPRPPCSTYCAVSTTGLCSPAALLAIVVLGVLIAWALDRFLYRHQRTATPLAKLVTSFGLLVALPSIVQLVLLGGNVAKIDPPPLRPGGAIAIDFLWPESGQYVLDANQIATLICTVAAVLFLIVLFRRGSLGLRMRAVVESPRLLQLQGVDAERVALSSWVLSSMLAEPGRRAHRPPVRPARLQLTSSPCWWRPSPPAVLGNLTSIPFAVVGRAGPGHPAGRAGRVPAHRQRAVHRPAALAAVRGAVRAAAGQAQHPAPPAHHRPAQRRRPTAGSARRAGAAARG